VLIFVQTIKNKGDLMKGVVVCPQPRAAEVGAEILEKGGNAFDAALATAFSQMVNDPFMCGLGGMGTLHYFHAATGTSGMIDFYNRAGSKVRPDMWEKDSKGRTPISGYSLFDDFRSEIGYTAIMTPGTPAGLGLFHEKLGSMPWADLIAPAIAQANEGILVTPNCLERLRPARYSGWADTYPQDGGVRAGLSASRRALVQGG
jgi:gamma-glutamyltranspeptidase/glutathione hydrolase